MLMFSWPLSFAGMYDHIKSLKRVGATDIPVGDSIESEDAKRARQAALAADKAKASIDVTNTEAVKEAIKTHITTVGKAKIAGFGPTSSSATSGVHSHPDSFHKRKGVVNTFGGAKDISRDEKAPGLPPRGPGGAMPGARIANLGSLDSHAEEGKAKRAAAEAKMRSNSSGPGVPSRGPGSTATGMGATIAGFNKNMGVKTIAGGVAKRTGGGGGATVSEALAAAGKGPSHSNSSSGSSYPRNFVGGSGKVGGPSTGGPLSATMVARSNSAGTSRSDPGMAAPASGGGAPAKAAAGGPPDSDAARRAAFFKAQMKAKQEATAQAVAMLKGEES
jgi:hypothetical protein